jgi:hypothetical protein
LGNATCEQAFGDSFKGLGRKLFGWYEFLDGRRDTDYSEFTDGCRQAPAGLSNGCRELMILIPNADPRGWQQRGAGREELHQVLEYLFVRGR